MLNMLNSIQEMANRAKTNCQANESNSNRALPTSAFNFGFFNEIRTILEKKDALIEKYRKKCNRFATDQQRS